MKTKELIINYKNSRIEFDMDKEEWVGYLGFKDGWQEEFKRHTSLKKLKDAIDRFNKKDFKPISILYFDNYNNGKIQNAEIISFTNITGECWIKNSDDRREKIKTVKEESGYSSHKKIYACENMTNEPILIKILEAENEILKAEKELEQKRKNKIHLIDSLEVFDIGGYVTTEEND